MKKFIPIPIVMLALLAMQACGPVLVSARLGDPPPPWFYPHRVETVRYVFFPDISIYYDLSTRTYIYLDGGIWVRHRELPSRYRSQDLNRYRYERIRNYYEDDIQRYHQENNANRGRSNKTVTRRSN